jgi:hypothetical protein
VGVRKPPLVLDSGRLLAYAVLGKSARYSGHSYLYVNGKELGPVPRLAIRQPLREAAVLLLHCAADWSVLGMSAYPSLEAAKHQAERIYPGAAAYWKHADVSERDVEAYLNKLWKGRECTLCGKRPDEVGNMVQQHGRNVCDGCIVGLHQALSVTRGGP